MAQEFSQSEIFDLIDKLAPAMGVDPRTAKIVIGAEHAHKAPGGGFTLPSKMSERASHVGATGVGQVMPKTREALVARGHLTPEQANDTSLRGQVAASLATIKEMLPRTGTDPLRIAAAYNGGERARKLYGTDQWDKAPAETQTHVKKAQYVMNQIDPNQSAAETQRLQGATPAAAPKRTSLVQPLGELFSGFTNALGSAIGGVRDYQAESDAGMEAAKQAVLDQAAGANMQATGAVEAAALKQTRVDQLTSVFGLTDADIAKNREEWETLEIQRRQLEQQVNDKLAVGFFDNPIQYLANMTRLPGMIEQHNALARQTQALNDDIATKQQLSSSQQAVTSVNVFEAMKKQEEGKAMENVAKANQQLAQLHVENAATNSKNLLTILSVESQRLEAGARLMQITRQEEEQKREFQEKTKKEQDEAVQVAAVNKTLAVIGSSVEPAVWKEMTAKEKAPLLRLVNAGSYGNSLAEAYEVITGSGLYNRNKADPALVQTIDTVDKQLNRMVQQEQAKLAKLGKTATEKETSAIRANALASLEMQWKEHAARGTDRERLDTESPYRINYNGLSALGIGTDGIVGKVIGDRKKSDMLRGAADVKFDDFASEALVQVLAGQTTPAKAAQHIAKFYQDADAANYASRGLAIFQLPRPEGYTVFAGPRQQQLDAENAGAVEAFLTIRANEKLREQLQWQTWQQSPAVQPFTAPTDTMIDGPRGPIPAPVRRN